jgi:LEA14-like dessication related protein
MRAITLMMAGILLGACGGGSHAVAPDLLPPEVELKQIGVRSVGLTGGTLDAKVAIRNPNGTTIRGTGLRLALDVQGHRFGETEWTRGFELAPDSVVTFTVPVSFEYKTVGRAAIGVLGHGDVRYAISGRTYLHHLGESWRFPFSREGSVPLVRLP